MGRDGDSLGVLLVVGVVVDLRAAAGWLGFGGDMAVRGEVRKSGASLAIRSATLTAPVA
ncbi:Uncharacterised protein [Mycobacterium tuberculosis]|nr:Uncharacterised protein [Mycobacterium tuberculosis]